MVQKVTDPIHSPRLQTENLQGAVSNLRALTLSLDSAFSPGLLFPSCFDIMDY